MAFKLTFPKGYATPTKTTSRILKKFSTYTWDEDTELVITNEKVYLPVKQELLEKLKNVWNNFMNVLNELKVVSIFLPCINYLVEEFNILTKFLAINIDYM